MVLDLDIVVMASLLDRRTGRWRDTRGRSNKTPNQHSIGCGNTAKRYTTQLLPPTPLTHLLRLGKGPRPASRPHGVVQFSNRNFPSWPPHEGTNKQRKSDTEQRSCFHDRLILDLLRDRAIPAWCEIRQTSKSSSHVSRERG